MPMQTTGTVIINGHECDYDAVVSLMDDEICELLHGELAPCSNQVFVDAYLAAHLQAHGSEFVAN